MGSCTHVGAVGILFCQLLRYCGMKKMLSVIALLLYIAVANETTLPMLLKALRNIGALEVKTVNMAQGQKESRFVAWTFLDSKQQQDWIRARWK